MKHALDGKINDLLAHTQMTFWPRKDLLVYTPCKNNTKGSSGTYTVQMTLTPGISNFSRYKIQAILFNVGYSKTFNISYMSYFPTNMSIK